MFNPENIMTMCKDCSNQRGKNVKTSFRVV